MKILWCEVRKGGFQFLWKMVLWGATFNAVVVVGVVSLLLFRLPMAILWTNSEFCWTTFTNFLNKINNIVPYCSCGRSNPRPIYFPLGIFTHKSIRPQTLLLGPSFNDYNSTIIWRKLMNWGSKGQRMCLLVQGEIISQKNPIKLLTFLHN